MIIMKVAVIGLGYAGLPFAVVTASKGIKVVGVEIDSERLNQLKNGKSPFFEPKMDDFINKSLGKNLELTSDLNHAMKNANFIFLCVNTPENSDGSVNFNFLKVASKQIGAVLKNSSESFPVIVVKSTVPPQTIEKLVIKEIEDSSGKKVGVDFGIAMNPEFMKEGSSIDDMLCPHIVVIGTNDEKSKSLVNGLFSKIYSDSIPPLFNTSLVNAELIKYVNNSFLATKISFINTIANICSKIPGADVEVIAKAIGKDPRIGELFLRAGPGYGGHCFPKDLAGFLDFSRKLGYNPELLESTEKTNLKQPSKIIERLEKSITNLEGKKISILGASFKKDTDDIRESPSIKVINILLEKGAKVQVHDPHALNNLKKIFDNKIEYCDNIQNCLANTEYCLLLTDWDEYSKLKVEDFKDSMKNVRIYDSRRILDPKKMESLDYSAVGYGL